MAIINSEVVTLVASILPLVALFQVFDSTCAICSGILRARGKQVCVPSCSGRSSDHGTSLVYWSSNQSEVNQHCIDWTSTYGFFSAYYVIGIPLGLWLTFKQNMELSGLWYGLTAALIYGSALGIWLSLTTNWNKEVAKVIERLAVDKKFRGQVDHERLRD